MKRCFTKTSFIATAIALCCTALMSCCKTKPCPNGTKDCDSVAIESRLLVHNTIQKWGDCRLVALTDRQGDLALHDNNTYVQTNCPKDLIKALDALKLEDTTVNIKDIVITEKGHWLILSGKNQVQAKGLPLDLEEKISQYQERDEEIHSISFNDIGDWIVAAEQTCSASEDTLLSDIQEDAKEFGQLLASCVTDDGIVTIHEEGYSIFGEVPEDLQEAISEADFDIIQVKMAPDESWFIADQEGTYLYDIVAYQ